jgi:N-acetylmuramic acid 6-phosphate etherase
VLNTISSAIMVRLNKVYGNLMVDLKADQRQAGARAVRLTMHATGADEGRPRSTLEQCDFHVKVGIVATAQKNHGRAGPGPAGQRQSAGRGA